MIALALCKNSGWHPVAWHAHMLLHITPLLPARSLKQGFAGELDFDAEMNKKQQQGKPGMRAGVRIQQGKTPTKKRQMKDAKFGFGGRKRLQKQNDAFSAADMSGYKPGKFKDGFGSKKGKGGGGGGGGGGLRAKGGVQKGGKGNRPGKARRQAMKQRR